jgi:hypothetical protein
MKIINTKIYVKLPLNACNEWNSSIWPQNANLHIFKKTWSSVDG